MRTVDVHAHVATPAADQLLADQPGFSEQLAAEAATMGAATAAYNREHFAALIGRLTDVGARLRAMDAGGIDVQTVSPTPTSRHWLEEALAATYVERVNTAVAAHCAQAPDRLRPVATVTTHLPALAETQLRYAVSELGAVGVQISTTAANGVELDTPTLDPFWAAVVELDVPVLIHPWGCSLGSRLDIAYLFNHLGNPTETSLALSRLIFGGVLDRFPELRLWSAHGGGWLPSYSGRADHAWHARSDARTCAQPPSWYLRRMWFDSLVYTEPALRHLVQAVGAEQVTLGTDFPFDMGVEDPVERVRQAFDDPGLREAICSRSAVALFGGRLPS
ncbi:amidohydrolase [Actinoplanes sp. KI2]|uniref:amidohydrolase family protein n=1 Tax=Actinoplanes sp. KI2 TaxID=2983315 RepID=UPI0021D59EB0|nr:amidohydrolase family protein [Actinoplanes sp. KI2]MCU7729588.1 amidohydrolase [Actinoplanes sp. KI2]